LSPTGPNQVSIVGGIPSAAVDVTIVPGTNAGGFFVSPSPLANFAFDTSFTNTLLEISQQGALFIIGGNTNCGSVAVPQACPGGGTIDMVTIPEPLTLSLFGAGLAGAAAMRRRKAKKA
jgi:hypothetical protein